MFVHFIKIVLVCVFSFVFVGVSVAKTNNVVSSSVVAIVDVPKILKLSKASKSVREKLEQQRSKFQLEIAKEEASLRNSEKELIKLRKAKKKDAFSKLEQKLQHRFLKVERHVQMRRKALDHASNNAMNIVRKNLVEVVSKISKEKGITLVIVKQQVIWNDSAVDLTDEVLKRLDKVLPQVNINILSDKEMENEKPLVIKR